ncbi:MAG: hypothetical protein K2Y16_06240 [Burkholderiales bacterium]|nr:hypothetical protein [Burkholderiales bacterium]
MSAGLGFVGEILRSSFVVLLLLGCALSFIYGVWMLLQPDQALRFNQRISAWVSTEGVSKVLDRPHSTERYIYRYHRIYGALLLAGGLFTLYVMSGGRWGRDMTAVFSLSEWSWLVRDVATLLMVMAGFLATALGIIMVIRPSLLRGVEARLNRWIATENNLKPLDSVYYAPDQFAWRHARPLAALIVIGSLYVLVALIPLLRTLF